jgi:hypothetical protein
MGARFWHGVWSWVLNSRFGEGLQTRGRGFLSLSMCLCLFIKSVIEKCWFCTWIHEFFDWVLYLQILWKFYGMFLYELYSLCKNFRSKLLKTKSRKIAYRTVLCFTVLLNLYFWPLVFSVFGLVNLLLNFWNFYMMFIHEYTRSCPKIGAKYQGVNFKQFTH